MDKSLQGAGGEFVLVIDEVEGFGHLHFGKTLRLKDAGLNVSFYRMFG